MLRRLLELVRDLAFFAEVTRQNGEEIETLRTQVHELAVELERLRGDMNLLRERERHEREKFMLAVENVLLQFERRLPPARKGGGKQSG